MQIGMSKLSMPCLRMGLQDEVHDYVLNPVKCLHRHEN